MNDKLLNKDLTIKVLSVMLAVLLWFYVITEQNPEITKDITIPVKLINLEYLDKNNMVLVENSQGYFVTLRIKGKKNTLDKLNDGTVTAYADLEGYNTKGENTVKISINGIPEGVNLLWKSSESIKVMLEPKVIVQRSVEVKVTGNPSQGLAALTPAIAPTDVVITGPESQVNKIKSVRVDVDIAGVNSEVKKVLPVRLLDEAGNDVQRVSVEPSNVNVSIPIENTKRVEVQLDITGQPAEGYMINGVSILPNEILITGKKQDLEGISLLKTENIDITGAVDDIDKEVKLAMPAGIELVNKEETVRVYVNIVKIITSQLNVSTVDYVNLPAGMAVESVKADLKVTLRGPESLLNDIQNTVRFYVDLKNAAEGSNVLDVHIDKPEGVEVVEVMPQQATAVLKKAGE